MIWFSSVWQYLLLLMFCLSLVDSVPTGTSRISFDPAPTKFMTIDTSNASSYSQTFVAPPLTTYNKTLYFTATNFGRISGHFMHPVTGQRTELACRATGGSVVCPLWNIEPDQVATAKNKNLASITIQDLQAFYSMNGLQLPLPILEFYVGPVLFFSKIDGVADNKLVMLQGLDSLDIVYEFRDSKSVLRTNTSRIQFLARHGYSCSSYAPTLGEKLVVRVKKGIHLINSTEFGELDTTGFISINDGLIYTIKNDQPDYCKDANCFSNDSQNTLNRAFYGRDTLPFPQTNTESAKYPGTKHPFINCYKHKISQSLVS